MNKQQRDLYDLKQNQRVCQCCNGTGFKPIGSQEAASIALEKFMEDIKKGITIEEKILIITAKPMSGDSIRSVMKRHCPDVDSDLVTYKLINMREEGQLTYQKHSDQYRNPKVKKQLSILNLLKNNEQY
jgi:hypothetical protein